MNSIIPPHFSGLPDLYQLYREEINAAALRVLESGWYVLGKEVESFEQKFAHYCGSQFSVGCASGTEAIALALMSLDIGPGDEVITASLTAVPTATGIAMTGATPVFADIDSNFLIDPSHVERCITSRTKAILPVHLYGQTADMDRLGRLAESKGIPLIEDACQAHGAVHNGRNAGSMGALGCFSFYPTKNLGCYGDGGAITTNDRDTYERLLRLRNYGQKKKYYHSEPGINSRLDEIQAAILKVKLKYLDQWNQRRRLVAKWYTEALGGVVASPVEAPGNRHIYHLYVIATTRRDELMAFLSAAGIVCPIHYPIPIHLQEAFWKLGYKRGSLPATETATSRIMSLPIHPFVTEEQVNLVASKICGFFAE